MKRIISGVIALTLLTSLGLAGASCVPIVEAKTGTIEVRVTDAPPSYGNIEEIWVTVLESEEEGIAVHKAVAEQEQEQEQEGEGEQNQEQEQEQQQEQQGEGEWIPISVTGDNPFELLELKEEGVDELLGWADVPVGKYTQIRMTIEKVEVIFEGEPEPIEAKLPSGKLKFVRPFNVVDGETTIILLDFDADKSVTVTGGGKVIFKPVIKLVVSGKGKPIELESSLEATYDATAELSTEKARRGKESVHLETTGTEGTGDEARIAIPLPTGTTLGDIESISWWNYLVSGYVPHVDLVLDYDEDSVRDDVLVAEGAHQNNNSTTGWATNSWIETFEGASGVYTSWAGIPGNCSDVTTVNDETAVWMIAANDANFGLDTLANFQSATGKTDGSITVNEETVVLAIEIEVDNWVLQTEAYVDDIEIVIGGVTYTVGL